MLCKLNYVICVISGFRLEVDEIYALLSHDKACSGNSLPTFRDKLSVPSSKTKKFYVGPIGCPETSVINYHCTLRNNPERHSSLLMNVMSMSVSHSAVGVTGRSKGKEAEGTFPDKIGSRETDPGRVGEVKRIWVAPLVSTQYAFSC